MISQLALGRDGKDNDISRCFLSFMFPPPLFMLYASDGLLFAYYPSRSSNARGEVVSGSIELVNFFNPLSSSSHTTARAPSTQNQACDEIGEDFMLSCGYIANDFTVYERAAANFFGTGGEGTDHNSLAEDSWGKTCLVTGVTMMGLTLQPALTYQINKRWSIGAGSGINLGT